SFPGAPAVVLGHNARIAWGATNVGPDVQDLFAEKVDPNDPDAYLYKGESKKFETRKETINVAGSDPVTITVRSSVHGPILNDVDDRLADAPPTALSWTTLLEPDGALESLFRLNTASSFDEFRAAFEVWGAPSQNFVYADVDGHVGYQLPGKIPIRDGAPNGDRIRNGTGLEDWTGWIPFEDLPWQLDPPNGLIVSANNAAVDDAYPYFISDDWDRGERAQRILDLLTLAAKDGVTTAEISAIQNDTHLLRADGIIPGLLELAKPATDDGRRLKDSIASWNRRCDIDSRGCAAYVSVELALVRKAFDDELGPLARDWVGSDTSGQLLQKLIAEPGNAWWDDITTDGVENGRTVSAAAFDAVGADLRATLGDQSRWTWGRLHTVTFRESTLGGSGIGPLEWYFNSATKPAPGAAGAIDNNYYQIWRGYPDPDDSESRGVGLADIFEVSNGPSYRFVVDMANLDGATIVITTGQSGNPFDRHYGDLIDEWLLGETVPLPFSGVAVQNATASTLALTP
ncbi:MAG TPA: penicillin acylase family protein, partial [Candidatus Polarisedimenticolia bacterium]|nr:penicillin acylase family protein [Candidatus Polarisedimenticolia bacterium]